MNNLDKIKEKHGKSVPDFDEWLKSQMKFKCPFHFNINVTHCDIKRCNECWESALEMEGCCK